MAKQQQASASASGGLRALVFLVLAIVAGAAATIVVYQLIQSYQARIAEAQKPEETVMAIVAAGDLFPGIQLTEQDLVGVEIPKQYLPAGAFTSHELVIGRTPRERILGNEFILPERLADGEAGIGLNALIPNGMRAISINIGNARALSGFLRPGNRVDLVVTIQGDDVLDRPLTLTLLQAVPVLAVNSQLDKAEDVVGANGQPAKKKTATTRQMSPSVTFAVTPEEAEIVAQAEQRGDITLTLRSDDDYSVTSTGAIDTQDVLGRSDEPVAKTKRPTAAPRVAEPTGLTIIRGTSKQQLNVNADGSTK
jgi:pilus assembly protein CpaB